METIIYRKTLDVHKNGIQFTLQGFETNDILSRRLEISLMASGDTVDFPLENTVAMMYITTPNSTEPSIEECSIKDNKVIYDVLPIVEEGITEMQLKIVAANILGARSVLVSPRFAVEVAKSNTDDTVAEKSVTYGALEEAVAKASAVYSSRFERMEIDKSCIFRAYYADGTVYESDEIRTAIMNISTDIDLDSMIKDGIAGFTAKEVADELDARYRDLLAEAKYVSNLSGVYAEPTFVRWDNLTGGTPYADGLTATDGGFALVHGDTLDHTIVAWAKGDSVAYVKRVTGGDSKPWTKYITSEGGVINGSLKVKDTVMLEDADGKQGAVGKSADGTYLANGETKLCVGESREDAAKVLSGGDSFKLYGEHNLAHPAQIEYGSYVGDGESKRTLTFNGEPKALMIDGKISVVRGATTAYWGRPINANYSIDVEWDGNNITLSGRDIPNGKDVPHFYCVLY